MAALPRPAEPGVRWLPREQWHITLRFLGEVDPDEAAAALARVSAPPAEVVLGPQVARLGRFVVCLPAVGLDDLAAAVVGATAAIGRPPDPRPFAGHLTLARLAHRGACGVAGTPFTGRFTADAVALVRSTTRSGGAEYANVVTHRLG